MSESMKLSMPSSSALAGVWASHCQCEFAGDVLHEIELRCRDENDEDVFRSGFWEAVVQNAFRSAAEQASLMLSRVRFGRRSGEGDNLLRFDNAELLKILATNSEHVTRLHIHESLLVPSVSNCVALVDQVVQLPNLRALLLVNPTIDSMNCTRSLLSATRGKILHLKLLHSSLGPSMICSLLADALGYAICCESSP